MVRIEWVEYIIFLFKVYIVNIHTYTKQNKKEKGLGGKKNEVVDCKKIAQREIREV